MQRRTGVYCAQTHGDGLKQGKPFVDAPVEVLAAADSIAQTLC
jgi:hypothetical protein